jgi:hypothetical protein
MLRERGLDGVDSRVKVTMDIRHELVSFDKVVGRKVLHCRCGLVDGTSCNGGGGTVKRNAERLRHEWGDLLVEGMPYIYPFLKD